MAAPLFLPPAHGHRQEFGAVLAALPAVRNGAIHRMDSALWLPNHRHAWAELHYVYRGRLAVELPGRATRRLIACGGFFMLTAPRRIHRARDGIMPPVHLLYLQLDLAHAHACRGTPFDAVGLALLRRALRSRYDSAWRAPVEASALFRRLVGLGQGSGDALIAAAVRAALAEMLVLAAQPVTTRLPPASLERALVALAAEPSCTVTAAARVAGMSPGTLHALCAEHLGTTPAAWQLARRLDRAREMLASGAEVTVVARTLGFSSPRYFAHAFRREIGIAPAQYASLRHRAEHEPVLQW